MSERGPVSQYMSPKIDEAFTQYCKHTDKPKYHHLEKAIQEYMIKYPLKGVNIMIPMDSENLDFTLLVQMVAKALKENNLTDV